MASTDRIEKSVVLRAPQERVWRAISNARDFGSWFGMEFEGDFAPGRAMRGRVVPTKVDPVVAKAQEAHAGMPVAIFIEEIVPMRKFSYRWHPFAIDTNVDYSKEPMTLVTFTLEPVDGGTKLTLTEIGFDSIPLARRADAFEANEEGWAAQLTLIEKYVLQPQA
jgi:uncharacterized protein YndB with AHSA1/START domain